jgi:cephalosporin hydroxylase
MQVAQPLGAKEIRPGEAGDAQDHFRRFGGHHQPGHRSVSIAVAQAGALRSAAPTCSHDEESFVSAEPRYLISHLVQRHHNLRVPTPGRVELEHRGTGERRAVAEPLWSALAHAARRPASFEELAVAAGEPEAVRALIAARFLVPPARDYWSDYVDDLGATPTLPRGRLAWSRDVIEPHRLWLYPTWLGFPVLQWPPDLVWMQMLLAEVRPAVLVETGLLAGGSAVFYASIFELLGGGEVISVELRVDAAVRAALAAHPLGRRITVVDGDSVDPAVVAEVTARVAGRRALVVLDSDHAAAHVRAELEAYAVLVDASSKLVVCDTSLSLCPAHVESNPHVAVRAFLEAHPEWRISPWAGAAFVSCAEDGILERLP